MATALLIFVAVWPVSVQVATARLIFVVVWPLPVQVATAALIFVAVWPPDARVDHHQKVAIIQSQKNPPNLITKIWGLLNRFIYVS